MMRYKLLLLSALATGLMASCQRDAMLTGDQNPDAPIQQVRFPEGFNFKTTADYQLSVRLMGPNNTPLTKTFIHLLDKPLSMGGKVLFKGLTGMDGRAEMRVTLPTYMKEVILHPGAIGMPEYQILPLNGNNLQVTLGGNAPTLLQEFVVPTPSNLRVGATQATTVLPPYNYLGTWDSQGRPNYLTTPLEVSNQFVTNVRGYLPEGQRLNTTRPDLLDGTYIHYAALKNRSEVFVSFLHEGAGYKNTLAFYAYNRNNPPSSPSDIPNLTIIYPNSSYPNSGGNLTSLSRVKIGEFGADTIIGFAVIADAWNAGTQTIRRDKPIFYDRPDFNPESNPALKQHTVLLHEISSGHFVMGMEDIINTASDYDFNDVIFAVSSNPIRGGFDTTDVSTINVNEDCDGDGIYDAFDDYRCDPARAFNNYYNTCLAFEDLWPSLGDYDFNDLVLNTNYKIVTNASNKVVDFTATYFGSGKGGMKALGFGVELPVPFSTITSISGCKPRKGISTYRSNGTESNQPNAVIIPFEDVADMFSGYSHITNTQIGGIWNNPDTAVVTVNFTPNTVSLNDLGFGPFNPFIFVEDRGREIHLADKMPTALANPAYFKKGMDNTDVGAGRTYKTANNLPWALALPVNFEYPHEMANIQQAYLKFMQWAISGGTQFQDWYSNKGAGYRNPDRFYRR